MKESLSDPRPLDSGRSLPEATRRNSASFSEPNAGRDSNLPFPLKQNRSWISIVALYALCAVLVLSSRLISPAFGSWNEVETILILASFLIVTCFGQGIVILTGGLDLSVGSIATLAGVLTTSCIGSGGYQLLLVPILGICMACGILNGLGVTIAKVPPFIMTLASGIILYSVCLAFSHGTPQGGACPLLIFVMSGRFLGIKALLIFVLLYCVVGLVLQHFSIYGRLLYAVGANARAATIAGLPVVALTISGYAISGLTAGLLGLMLVGYSNGATLRMGDPYVLTSVAAVVVGGSSILGGRGSFAGTMGGAILLTTLSTIIAALGIEQGWRTILEGTVIVCALLLLGKRSNTKIRRNSLNQ